MEMVSLLTGSQRELASFYSQSYLASSGTVEKVICNSISPNQGYLVYVLINSVCILIDYVKESLMGLLPQRNRREGRRKDAMFSCMGPCPSEEML